MSYLLVKPVLGLWLLFMNISFYDFFHLPIHLWQLSHLKNKIPIKNNGDSTCSKGLTVQITFFSFLLRNNQGSLRFQRPEKCFWTSKYLGKLHSQSPCFMSVQCEPNTVLGLGDIRPSPTWQASFQLQKFKFDFRNCTFMWITEGRGSVVLWSHSECINNITWPYVYLVSLHRWLLQGKV